MLSDQCDRLRKCAEELELMMLGKARLANRVALAVETSAYELRLAADTIWELRNKCNDLIDEREELSRRLEHATEMNSMLIGMPEHDRRAIASTLTTIDGINLSERIRELEAENAKLRELVVQAHECKTNDGCCEDCYQDEGCCPIERDMEELRIEP